jgi:hypothetical protein
MDALAILIWLLATVVVGVPVGLLLRRLDAPDVEEVIDPAELHEAMGRHPSRSKVA